jgi:large subunit ribosomal protein L10
VVKNSIFRVAAKEAGVADLSGSLTGQLAVVTGQKDVSAAAKVLKSFNKETSKGTVQFGYLNSKRLENKDLMELADLPSLDVLRAKILGTVLAPASQLARIINTPAAQLAQVIKAHSEKEEKAAA